MSKEKILFIVRHAKSSWDIEDISDVDRPLKLRGIRDAYEMARRLKINRIYPQYFITSPANRAIHTANIFMTVFEADYSNFSIDSRFYSQGKKKILEVIRSQPSSIGSLIIFGHNPDFSELVREFAHESFFELPTCGVAIFKFTSDTWEGIKKGNLKSEYFDYPKKD